MTIVSNASPLINLARIGKLDLLHHLYDTVLNMGLRYTGLVGLLIEAKYKGLITEVKSHLDALRWEANFRVSNALYRRVLRDEGEKL
jgi:predicted nucleic acid-binding protein